MKDSLSHRRRKAHTIWIILSCLADSAVVRDDDNPPVRSMGQISDLYKYEPNHGQGTLLVVVQRDQDIVWQWQITLGHMLGPGSTLLTSSMQAQFSQIQPSRSQLSPGPSQSIGGDLVILAIT